MGHLNNKNRANSEQNILNQLVYAYAQTQNQLTRADLQRFIVAACYRNRKRSGEYSGGKSGSLSFDILPSTKADANQSERDADEAQRQYYHDLMKKINDSLHTHLKVLHKTPSDFLWQGSTRFQMKFDSSRSHGLQPIREEMNENVAELLVSCISEELKEHPSLASVDHPNAIAFVDENNQTVIASQYMPNTLGTLSGFVGQSIEALRTVNENLMSEHYPNIQLDALRKRYEDFDTKSNREIALVSEDNLNQSVSFFRAPLKFLRQFINRQIYDDQTVAIRDLDVLAKIYAISENQVKDDSLNPDQPLLKRLVEEISFSHLIADHDVNPGNFIIRRLSNDLVVSRIDFGMANYHFTRGRIYGLSRRPFKNIVFDIEKESLQDFICRKKIGFGFGMFFTLVASKTSRHLSALKRMFLYPDDISESTLVNQACALNEQTHDVMSQSMVQERIIQSFMHKINHLPDSSQLDILRDLKVMELQSVRKAYLNFSPPETGRSVLKLGAMLSLTPLLMVLRLAYSPIVTLSGFLPSAYHLTNTIPLTTWTLLQSRDLHHVLNDAQKDPLARKNHMVQCLSTVLENINSENKHHLTKPVIQSLVQQSMHSKTFDPYASIEPKMISVHQSPVKDVTSRRKERVKNDRSTSIDSVSKTKPPR